MLTIPFSVLKGQISAILGLSSNYGTNVHAAGSESHDSERARREMLGLVEALNNVGLTGEKFQVIFAEIMDNSMTEYVSLGCKGFWSVRRSCTILSSKSLTRKLDIRVAWLTKLT